MVDGRGSVHILGGLDIDEMDCSEYSFDFIVLVTSSGTTNEYQWEFLDQQGKSGNKTSNAFEIDYLC